MRAMALCSSTKIEKGTCRQCSMSWVQLSCSVMSNSLQPHGLQMPGFPVHHQLLELAKTHVHWVGDATISSSVIPFSSCLQYDWTSGSFQMSQLFASGGQNIGVSASTWVLPMNTQDWFPLGWTGWISLQSKGLRSLLQHHSSKASILRCSAFFIFQLSHPYMIPGKTIALTRWTFVGKVISLLFSILYRFVIPFFQGVSVF